MKVTNLIINVVLGGAATLALASPTALAAPEPDALSWCKRRGEPCDILKRSADAMAEALAAPDPGPLADADAAARVWCWRPHEPCSKAKRDAIALAEAVAEAHFVAESPDTGPILDTRDVEKKGRRPNNALEMLASKGEDTAPGPSNWCHRPHEPCSKIKRAAKAMADALAEPAAEPKAGAEAEARNWCWRPHEPCSKAKRGLEELERRIIAANI